MGAGTADQTLEGFVQLLGVREGKGDRGQLLGVPMFVQLLGTSRCWGGWSAPFLVRNLEMLGGMECSFPPGGRRRRPTAQAVVWQPRPGLGLRSAYG